ncbi:MAG: DUF1667 domain-containing protein [Clostridiaceae bacterium]|nr:DUF1667 domain-containing protein [Clostridiaceae bacterium]
MERIEKICIGCPLGCIVNVELEDGIIKNISNYSCKRGEVYARKEITNPERIVTSTVKVNGGERPLVSVKTKENIPKSKIFDCMKEINSIVVNAPIHLGDVLIENVAGTNVPIIATCSVRKV